MSDYSEYCACDIYSGDGPEFFNEEHRRARKQYKCSECRQEIKPGETYLYEFSVYCGAADWTRTCERCADLCAALHGAGWCPYNEMLAECYHTYLKATGGIIDYDPDEDGKEGEELRVHNHMTGSDRFQRLIDKVITYD